MIMNHAAVCLVALALFGSLCSGYQKPGQTPHDQQQAKHLFEQPLTWTYPEGPTVAVEHVPDFEQRHPVPAATVSVECGERQARVEAQVDFFGIGQFIKPDDLTLGPCGAVAEDTQARVLIFETELQDCGSMLRMTDDALIYTFTLNYNPTRLGDSIIVRTNEAAVIVECHYPRHHNVSSLPLEPNWIPFSAVRVAEEFLYFTLTLRTDDWIHERPRYQYYLGDMIRIEASVMQYHHVPLRVFVETCTATLSPDMNSSPRYCFLDTGCLIDAVITGADSRFMQRTVENMLQFQFEAFRFQGADSGMLYITCHLRATSTGRDIDADHRACSYINGWREASGVDSACSTCGTGGHQQTTGGGGSGSGNWNTGGGGGSQTGGGKWNTGSGGGSQTGGGTWNPSGGGGSQTGGGNWNPGGGGGGSQTGGTKLPGGKQTGVFSGTSWGSGSSGSATGSTTWHSSSSVQAGDGQAGKQSWNPGGSPWSGARKGRSVKQAQVYEWRGDVTLGPFEIAEKLA